MTGCCSDVEVVVHCLDPLTNASHVAKGGDESKASLYSMNPLKDRSYVSHQPEMFKQLDGVGSAS